MELILILKYAAKLYLMEDLITCSCKVAIVAQIWRNWQEIPGLVCIGGAL